jgi:hypothetical protein
VCYATVYIDAECASHVDEWDGLFVGQPVEKGTRQVFVHAGQHYIAALKVLNRYVISQMTPEGYDLGFQAQ